MNIAAMTFRLKASWVHSLKEKRIRIVHQALREKYDLHMTVERFISEEIGTDERFIRK